MSELEPESGPLAAAKLDAIAVEPPHAHIKTGVPIPAYKVVLESLVEAATSEGNKDFEASSSGGNPPILSPWT